MKKLICIMLAVIMALGCMVAFGEDDDYVLTPKEQELSDAYEYLLKDISEEDIDQIFDWSREDITEKLSAYDAALTEYTKDELAQDIYDQLQILALFMSWDADEDGLDLGSMFSVRDPLYDATQWESEDQVLLSTWSEDGYQIVIAATEADIVNDTGAVYYLCDLDDLSGVLTSKGVGVGGAQADEGLGSTFTPVESDDYVGYLVWTNASGRETRFAQKDERFLGEFVSQASGAVTDISWDKGFYDITVTFTDGSVFSYHCYQGLYSETLTGIAGFFSAQPDEGIGFFTYDEYDYSLDFLGSDGAEDTFYKVFD